MTTYEMFGKRFGRLTVTGIADPVRGFGPWVCECDCGKVTTAKTAVLNNGTKQSCGCYQRDRASEANRTHGRTYTRAHGVWMNMRARCSNPKNTEYHNYGGRGIKVCERWDRSFENFLADMGECPPGLTIERNDNNGNYEPGNCRWATYREQGRNKRNNCHITFRGRTMILADWARELGVDPGTLRREWLRDGTLKRLEGK